MVEISYELDLARSLWAQSAEAASEVLRKLGRAEKKVIKLSGREKSMLLGEIEVLHAQYKVLLTINSTRWDEYKQVEAKNLTISA
jgi:hypothetical protein